MFSSAEWKDKYAINSNGDKYPIELHKEKINKLHKLESRKMLSIMAVSNFEKQVYEEQNLTVEKIKELLPDLKGFDVDRYELPNILSLNFYVHGILQDGVSSSTRLDGQAKSLGEYIRAKNIEIPDYLLN